MRCRDTRRLLTAIGAAALVVAVACFGSFLVFFRLDEAVAGAIGLPVWAIAIGVMSRRLFRKLQPDFNRREAQAIAISFAVSSPISLAIALILYDIPGIVANAFMPKSGFGFLVVLFLGIALISAFLTILACLLALWVTRRTEKAESHDDSAQIGKEARLM